MPSMLRATQVATDMRFGKRRALPVHTLACCLLSANTWGQTLTPRWEEVDTAASTDADGDTYAVDTSGLRTSTEGVEVKMLIQLRHPRPLPGTESEVRSIIRIGYIDCAHHRWALTAIESFSDPGGLSNPVEFIDMARDPLQWHDIETGSSDDSIHKVVCARVHEARPTQSRSKSSGEGSRQP
jgi:surface-adhesin protein E